MIKHMCWLPTLESKEDKVLHLRTMPNQPWQSYKAFPSFAVPDHNIPGGSKGWATYQKLRREGWTLIPSDQAQAQLPLYTPKRA